MSILTPDGLPYRDRNGNTILPSYRNMIRLETLLMDDRVNETVKTTLGLQLLYGTDIPEDKTVACIELSWFYYCGNPPTETESKKRSVNRMPRTYDFEEDAGFIYAGFMQAYGVDLVKWTPHWWEFMALFLALPENTQMAQRMFFRGVDTSKMKGAQKKYYEERKRELALKNAKSAGKTLREIEQMNRDGLKKRYEEMNRALREKNVV